MCNGTFEIITSTNLLTWTPVVTLTIDAIEYTNLWSPNWFTDADGSIHIIVSNNNENGASSDDEDFHPSYRLLEIHPLNSDPSTWGLESGWSSIGGGFNTLTLSDSTAIVDHNDGMVWRDDSGLYHIFAANYAAGSDQNHIDHYTSHALTTGWNLANTGRPVLHKCEGPFMLRLPNGTRRLYYANWVDYGEHGGESAEGIRYIESTDDGATWNATPNADPYVQVPIGAGGMPTYPQHGAVVPIATESTVADAKQSADSSTITLTGKVITYASNDFFYIEEDNRNTGIMVQMRAHGLSVGMRADVSGTMKTNANTERYILASSAVQTAAPNSNGAVLPVGMNNYAIGGGDWTAVGTGGQKATTGSIGLNNIGLLVKTWGAYQPIDATTFTVDDGAGRFVKCTVPPGTFLSSEWQYVSVIGISSMCMVSSEVYLPNILVSDIQGLLPVDAQDL